MPNMDNAYMVARAVYNAEKDGGGGVTLHFKPIVTAIEVEIKAGSINPNTTDNTLKLTSASLSSASKKDICGAFSTDLSGLNTDENLVSGVAVTNINKTTGDHNRVTIDLNDKDIVLKEDESCAVTFFILPTAEFNNNNTDLKLTVFYTSGGVTTSKICTLGKEVKAHKKYFFKNLKLPNITTGSNSSNWFGALDDDIYLSQLSIPGAGNAASYNYKNNNQELYKEQTLSLEEQWNLGIRCFELITDRNTDTNSSLLSKNLVCNQASVGITYSQALTTLTNLLKANPRECVIVISSYQPSESLSGGRSCQTYMNNLANSFPGASYNGVDIAKWEMSSTVGEMRRKLIIIGRISQEGEDSNLDLTNIPTWLTYIKGWGSLKDKWNRRFGPSYNPDYNHSYKGSTLKMEDRLWKEMYKLALSSTITTTIANPSGYPAYAPNFEYSTNGGGVAWVQEWMRVSPGISYMEVDGSGNLNNWGNSANALYFHWPNSYDEKYNNIVLTFERAKNIQDIVYINSLCGYYITTSFKNSYTPYASGFKVNGRSYKGGQLGSGGMGGDFKTYNIAMNERVYDYILKQSHANTTGPMGIVMVDYIGNGSGGVYLPSLILQNNFKFPLRKKIVSRENTDYDATYTDGGNAIE